MVKMSSWGPSWKRGGPAPSFLCIIEGGRETGRALGSLTPHFHQKLGGFPRLMLAATAGGSVGAQEAAASLRELQFQQWLSGLRTPAPEAQLFGARGLRKGPPLGPLRGRGEPHSHPPTLTTGHWEGAE